VRFPSRYLERVNSVVKHALYQRPVAWTSVDDQWAWVGTVEQAEIRTGLHQAALHLLSLPTHKYPDS
jgi:hypothetical protein